MSYEPDVEMLEYFTDNQLRTIGDIRRTPYGAHRSNDFLQGTVEANISRGWLIRVDGATATAYRITQCGHQVYAEYERKSDHDFLVAGLKDSIHPFLLRFVFEYYLNKRSMPLDHYETAVLVYWRMRLGPRFVVGRSDTQVDEFILEKFRPDIQREVQWCLKRGWIRQVKKNVFTMTAAGVEIVHRHTK